MIVSEKRSSLKNGRLRQHTDFSSRLFVWLRYRCKMNGKVHPSKDVEWCRKCQKRKQEIPSEEWMRCSSKHCKICFINAARAVWGQRMLGERTVRIQTATGWNTIRLSEIQYAFARLLDPLDRLLLQASIIPATSYIVLPIAFANCDLWNDWEVIFHG